MHAANGLSPIFDKEKEQRRLKQARLIGEIGGQAMDIAATQGKILAMNAGKAELEAKGIKAPGQDATPEERAAYDQLLTGSASYKTAQASWGTGSAVQQGIQAATAAIQGLAGGNVGQLLSGAAAPYLAEQIHQLAPDEASRAIAHAVVGAIVSYEAGNSAAAGAAGAVSGELMAQLVMKGLYAGKQVSELTETEKQTVSVLGTLAAGLAGGVTGGSAADGMAGALAGKNAVENNLLGATSSERLDKAVEKIRQGDKSLAAANELLKLENADKRSDALVAKFTQDPSQMSSSERAELTGYLRVYAAEMEKEYGPAVSEELVKSVLSGQDYIKRNPDSEAMSKAQTIMNTWGYHKSNASIGDTPLIFGGSVLGTTIKEGMALNAVIGMSVNTSVQLSGKDPFSYVDAAIAGIAAAATTGKGIASSAGIFMGGAVVGSAIKGEDPTNAVIGTGLGSVVGGSTGKIISGSLGASVKESTAGVISNIGGSVTSEAVGNTVKGTLDEADKKTTK